MKNIRVNKAGLLMIYLLMAMSFSGFAQTDEKALEEIKKHRDEKEVEFKDPEKSPLEKKEIRKFKGLKYYPVDLNYRVTAKFIKNEAPVLFKMKTTTDRLPDYVKYGEVVFSLLGVEYKLEVYQSPDVTKKSGYEDHLFIPFTDATNGNETYDVGRYLELRIPSSEEVVLDFNQCYNPYCSYSPRYSCPIPPEVNRLPIELKAGEKKYKDH